MAQSPDDEHFQLVAKQLMAGAVVPFLGAGVSVCGRPPSESWERGRYLPSGAELTEYLAEEAGYPTGDPRDLLRVSQYFDVKLGSGPLYEALHTVFDADYSPTPMHRFLASLPAMIRRHRSDKARAFPLYVSTNYDTLLEQALRDAGEEYDLVTYLADGPDKSRFVHVRPNGESTLIAVPNTYPELTCTDRPVVAKIHGAVGRTPEERESFVITENHYIAYLSHSDIAKLIPVHVTKRMQKSHFLFLGYNLRDWNLRVILHRLWGDEGLTYNSWAIQANPDKIEERAWYKRGVELLDSKLEDYADELRRAIEAPAPAGVAQ
jgi:SIR2-like protein